MGGDDVRIKQREALEKAKEAAVRKDGRSFLQHLDESKFLDGARRRLVAKYGEAFDESRVEEVLATGVDKFYEAITEGKKVLNPATYLWMVIRNHAYDTCAYQKAHTSGCNLTVEELPGPGAISTEEEPDEDRVKKLKEGLKAARSLLPKIGQDNVQSVMGYIFEVIEKRLVTGEEIYEEILSPEIAEALGLSTDSVRKWRERGFNRLKREAIKAGYREEFLRDMIWSVNSEDEDIEE